MRAQLYVLIGFLSAACGSDDAASGSTGGAGGVAAGSGAGGASGGTSGSGGTASGGASGSGATGGSSGQSGSGGSAGSGDVPDAEILTQTEAPTGLRIDDANVYWSSSGTGPETLYKMPKTGGTPEPLLVMTNGDMLWDFTLDQAGNIYVIISPPVAGIDHLARLEPNGTLTDLADPFWGGSLQADATHLYWSENNGARIARVAKTGGAVEDVVTDLTQPQAFRLEGSDLYLTDNYGETLAHATLTSPTPVPLWSSPDSAGEVELGDTFVMVATATFGSVQLLAIDKTTHAETVLASPNALGGYTSNANYVYYGTENTVMRTSHDGSGTLAVGQYDKGGAVAGSMQLDSTHLYFAVRKGNIVARIPL